MELTAENKFKKLIVVGDRVLIRPKKDEERTKSGLYLPPGVKEKPGLVIPFHYRWKKMSPGRIKMKM